MSGYGGFVGLEALAGLAILSAMSGGAGLPRKQWQCRYSTFCGPPHPTTRQQRRALMRAAETAGRALDRKVSA